MDLSINLENKKKKIKIKKSKSILKNSKFCLYFKLSNSKFAKDLQNTQTQNPNTQKIENPNPDLNLWVFLGAYVWTTLDLPELLLFFVEIMSDLSNFWSILKIFIFVIFSDFQQKLSISENI
jgi:hypothetical protein